MAKASRTSIKVMRQLGEIQGGLDAQEIRLVQQEKNMEQVLKRLEEIKGLLKLPEPAEILPVKPRRRGRPKVLPKEGAP